ncbi:hypothetical protein B7P34_06785 [Streptosporangium nondiastaticum]|uniref:Uncharacterized protein n=2 Tax=Streptosporangium nondiastaticum TaxID=35764 RepID=A0A9X7JTD4_9ACTN|nr:hypothetical protein B7P34_06785 [Streptosporangium nondiastaticum]
MMFENWSDERLTDLYHKMQDSPGTNALPGGSLPLFIREVRKMSLGDIIWRPRPGEMEKSPNNP